MIEVIFLFVLGMFWIFFATMQDIRTRIVSNWLSFSLIVFALGFRLFYSLFNNDFNVFYQGLIGLGIFFILGNALYYGRIFAGGDAKLMIALGTVLPFSENFFTNLNFFAIFLLLFLIAGSIYGFLWSFALPLMHPENYKKEIARQFRANRTKIIIGMFFGIALMFFGFSESFLFYLGILVFVLPLLYIHAKSVDESCLIREIDAKKLTEGDWLYRDLKIGKKTIKPSWHGLSETEIKEIGKRHKKVMIRNGIPFVPVFLISFLVFASLYFSGFEILRGSFWNPQFFF